jgi:hypothetical protein
MATQFALGGIRESFYKIDSKTSAPAGGSTRWGNSSAEKICGNDLLAMK